MCVHACVCACMRVWVHGVCVIVRCSIITLLVPKAVWFPLYILVSNFRVFCSGFFGSVDISLQHNISFFFCSDNLPCNAPEISLG